MSGTAGDRKAFANVQLSHRKRPLMGAWDRVINDLATAEELRQAWTLDAYTGPRR